ncbi:MAG: hypothetical protein ACKVUS_04540 [Saprospiraceae bacterium]
MQSTSIAPTNLASSLEARKVQLLARIAKTEDEELIEHLEEIFIEEGESATDEEIALVEARIAEFRKNPEDFVTLEAFVVQLKQA